MTYCEYILDCPTAEEYRLDRENEQNSAVRELLKREFRNKCQENHEDCQTRRCLANRIRFKKGSGEVAALSSSILLIYLLDSIIYEITYDGEKPIEMKGAKNILNFIEKNKGRIEITTKRT